MAKRKSSKLKKFIIFGIIVIAVGGLAAVAFLKKHETVIRVETEKVTRRNVTETVVANGQIQPVTQVKISAEVSGEIVEMPVKEGDQVHKGDLLAKIKPDTYLAARRSSEANYQSALASQSLQQANLQKAELEFKRNQDLYNEKLISGSTFLEFKTALEIAKAQAESAGHQVSVAKASLDRSTEELAKTTILSPLNGTISKLNLEVGERVAGNTMMSGTEIMTVADLNTMEALVDVGEVDVVHVGVGQPADLEVDAFPNQKFKGTVTEIANSSKISGSAASQQEAVKFEVRIRVDDKADFRPGMSVTADIHTRSRTNVLTVPIQSVTTRKPKSPKGSTNLVAHAESNAEPANVVASNSTTQTSSPGKKSGEPPKPIEVVFVVEGDHVKMVPVKRGISDDQYTEITEGLKEGEEVVSGGYNAISRELEDGTKIQKGLVMERKKTSEE